MAKEYRIVPKAKTLAELRGIEEISLFFPEPQGIAETEIDQIIVDCKTQEVILRLRANRVWDEELRARLAAQFSGLLKAKCKVEVLPATTAGPEPAQKITEETLSAVLKESFPAVFAWLASPPLSLDPETQRLTLRVNSSLAVDYIRSREKQLLACLPQIDDKDYKLTYEIDEEVPEPPPRPGILRTDPSLPETKGVPGAKGQYGAVGRKINEEPVPVGEERLTWRRWFLRAKY